MSFIKEKWEDFNRKCLEGIEDENTRGEMVRMNNNFLFTIVITVFPFTILNIYFGLYSLLVSNLITISFNFLFLYWSSTKKYKFLGHYLIFTVYMAAVCYSDNYMGERGVAYLFYYTSLTEFALTYLNKRISVVLVNLLSTLFFMFISFYFDHSLFLNPDIPELYYQIIRWSSFISVGFIMIFHILTTMFTRKRYEKFLEYEKNMMEESSKKITQEKILLEMQNQDAEYRILKNQLNPHFIFNTLDTIKHLAKTDTKKLDEFVASLSEFLRISLKNESSISSVKDEVNMLNNFMNLQLVRFSGAIFFENKMDEKTLGYYLPYFSLITLVENAIKHNNCTVKNPLMIHLYNDQEYIYIKNNIQKKNFVIPSTGIGLKNLNERYKFLYDIDLQIEEKPLEFCVKLKFIKD